MIANDILIFLAFRAWTVNAAPAPNHHGETSTSKIAWRASINSVLSCYSSSIDVQHIATATTTGALSTTILAPSIPQLPPGPNATSYPRDGKLHGPQPMPYMPSGGRDNNGSEPVYVPQSD